MVSIINSIEFPVYAVVMTGTPEKYKTFEDVVVKEGICIHGILGMFQFAEAGQAKEPVTTDCVELMVEKQINQRRLFLSLISQDKEMQRKYNGQYLLLASNDINTNIDGVPLTKSTLQKEGKLSIDQYKKLITASLKYLAMKNVGVQLKYTWEEMQSSTRLIDECLNFEWNGRSFISIDYQASDAYSTERLTVTGKSRAKLERQSPTILVIDRAYAQLELDFRNGNDLVNEIVSMYLIENWQKVDFQPGRYPLGIKQRDLLFAFVKADQQVLFSDHEIPEGESLKSLHKQSPESATAMLDRIDQMLNGFSKTSLGIARRYIDQAPKDRYDSICVVTRKPGYPDNPRWKKRAKALR